MLNVTSFLVLNMVTHSHTHIYTHCPLFIKAQWRSLCPRCSTAAAFMLLMLLVEACVSYLCKCIRVADSQQHGKPEVAHKRQAWMPQSLALWPFQGHRVWWPPCDDHDCARPGDADWVPAFIQFMDALTSGPRDMKNEKEMFCCRNVTISE